MMKIAQSPSLTVSAETKFPDAASLSALRSWYAGMTARAAVARYLPHAKAPGQSARGMLGCIRRQLITFALSRHRDDLAGLFKPAQGERHRQSTPVARAIELLRSLPIPTPQITDDIGQWFAPRSVRVLRAHGINTLADLTVRIPRRRGWWSGIAGLGVASARKIEAFFAAHPALTERARALIAVPNPGVILPWEQQGLPHDVDGSRGRFRAPRDTCMLKASNDYEAVQAWLALHEAPATQRAYRKEAERLILWAIVERKQALSSLTTDDVIAYRAFLRRPTPHARWIGLPRPRDSIEWRPYARALSARSIAYALSVLGALFRWLIAQRYMLANPFSGIKVRGNLRGTTLDTTRGFTEDEWVLVRNIADELEDALGWAKPAAARLRFLLDFAYATGLRISELVGATLGNIQTDEHDDHWLYLVGKGSKPGKVSLPPLARTALDQYLVQRGLSVLPARWSPKMPVITNLDKDGTNGITSARLWHVMRRFFHQMADRIQDNNPATADKLRRASPHWMRHSHASHALARGAELTSVRDNLRHASIATTSAYLHGDEVKRARQIGAAFGARK